MTLSNLLTALANWSSYHARTRGRTNGAPSHVLMSPPTWADPETIRVFSTTFRRAVGRVPSRSPTYPTRYRPLT